MVSPFAGFFKINPPPTHTQTNGVGVLLFNYYTYRWSCPQWPNTHCYTYRWSCPQWPNTHCYTYRWSCPQWPNTHCLQSDWPFCCWCFELHANCKLPILPNFKTVQHSGNYMCQLLAHKHSLHFPTQCTYVPHDSHNNQLVLVMEMLHVLCDVETEFLTTLLYVILLCRWTLSVKGLNMDSWIFQYQSLTQTQSTLFVLIKCLMCFM